MATTDYKLLMPLTLGEDFELRSRIVLAPLVRARANANRTLSELQGIYYEQRAGAGLVITESTAISDQGYGSYRGPALYTKDHADGWKKIVDRVHAKGGKIVVQLWHMGRKSHPSYHEVKESVAPSAIRVESGSTRDVNGQQSKYVTPRALETDEIPGIVEDYRRSAELALQAGFDGVEIHGANGYLLDTFLQSSTNKRMDSYGGSFENRARVLFEVLDAVKTVWFSDRIGVRLSPNGAHADMGSEDNFEFFTYVMEHLSTHNLAYLATIDAGGFFGFHNRCRPITVLTLRRLSKVLLCRTATMAATPRKARCAVVLLTSLRSAVFTFRIQIWLSASQMTGQSATSRAQRSTSVVPLTRRTKETDSSTSQLTCIPPEGILTRAV